MSVNKDLIKAFLFAAIKDHGKARRMLKKYPQLRECEIGVGESPLCYLAIESYAEAVEFLAGEGFAFDDADEFGNTPLMQAAVVGSDEVAEVLLRLGANPNAGPETSDCALISAVSSANPRLVRLLLDHGARTDCVDYLDRSVMEVVQEITAKAKQQARVEIERMLKEAIAQQSGD